MVMLFVALVIGVLMLIWIWKVPITGLVNALQKGGSTPFEAYAIVVLLIGGSAAVIFMIWEVM